jgi:D-amino-acid dehydrogenase
MGPRPITPDGLPYIGQIPGKDRVFVAAGHNMLGVMLAPSTAHALAQKMAGAEVPVLSAFSLARRPVIGLRTATV